MHVLEPSSHIRAVFNNTLLGSGLVQLLSVTPIVKNGFLVKLPFVRVLSFFIYFIQGPPPHSLALNPHSLSYWLHLVSTLADARPRPSFHSIRLGASMRTRLPRRTNRSRQSLVQCIASSCLEFRYSLITTHTQLELPRRGLQRHVIRPRCILYITTSLHYSVRLMGKTCCSSRPAEPKRVF